jgi:tetratricopeptide (TPR) repeat protein
MRSETPFRQYGFWPAIVKHYPEVLEALQDVQEAKLARQEAARTPLRTKRDHALEAMWLTSRPGPHDTVAILALLDGAERMAGSDANFWAVIGFGYRDAGRLDRAQTCFNTSLSLDADQPWTWAARGEVRMATDLPGAIGDFDHAIGMPGADRDLIRRNRALARELVGDLAGAEADLNELVKEHPERLEYLDQRARVRRLKAEARGANKDVAALLSGTPQSPRGWLARSRHQKDANKALADLNEALARDPEFYQALINKAEVLSERLGRADQAVTMLTRAIELNPDAAEPRAARAVLYARLGRRDAALSDAREALRASPRPIHVYQASNAYALTSPKSSDDRQAALRLLARAVREDPKLLEMAATDPDFSPLKNDNAFRALLDAARLILK